MSRSVPPKSGARERAALAAAVEQEAARIRKLEAERADVATRLADLRGQLAAVDALPVEVDSHGRPSATPPRSPTEKVKLFRDMFRGRDDLYPTRFVSMKTEKRGTRRRARTSSSPGSASSRK